MNQINIFEEMGKPRYKITKPIRLIELFAGIGAQAKALENLNVPFEHYKVCEFEKYALASYNAIHGTNFETSDVRHLTDLGIVEKDKYEYILTYSFPCTDLSLAGKRAGMKKGSGTRSGLLWEVERLLKNACGFKEHRIPPSERTATHSIADFVDDFNFDIDKSKLPQILLMENVPQVVNSDFHEWQRFLENLGYSNYTEILNAKDYGIPQNRERCFMVSVLGDYYYKFPEKQKLTLRLKDMLEDEVDERYYLSEKMLDYCKKATTAHSEKGNGFKFKPINKGEAEAACSIIAKAGSRIEENYIAEPKVMVKGNYNPSGYSNGNIVDTNGLAPVVMENHGTVTAIMEEPKSESDLRIRKLTPKECFRLMGFSDADFEKASKVNSNSQLYKQAGNSIVVNVLMEIFRGLL